MTTLENERGGVRLSQSKVPSETCNQDPNDKRNEQCSQAGLDRSRGTRVPDT